MRFRAVKKRRSGPRGSRGAEDKAAEDRAIRAVLDAPVNVNATIEIVGCWEHLPGFFDTLLRDSEPLQIYRLGCHSIDIPLIAWMMKYIFAIFPYIDLLVDLRYNAGSI